MTRSDRLRCWLQDRRGQLRDQLRDDRGSLPLVMLVTMVGVALAAGLLPTMLVQDHATAFDGSRTNDFAAAQAGIDATVGKIRAATKANGSGDPSKLPCASPSPTSGPGPITGTVNSSGTATYSAYLTYYREDPVANPSAPAMLCVPGSGPYLKAAERVTPSYALITSTGTDGTSSNNGSAGRTIVSTYVFQTDTSNIAGGQIRITPNVSTPMCLDAGSSLPTVTSPRTAIRLAACSPSTATLPQQVFSYRSDLTLQVATSITPDYPNGLCFDTDTAGLTVTPVAGNPVYLEACSALGNPPWSQQWSINDFGGWTAATAASKSTGALAGVCLDVASQNPQTTLLLQNCINDTGSPRQAWLPVPTVGAGAAAAPGSQQVVNYQQFGRCMDVNGGNTSPTNLKGGLPQNYLIGYFCKQNPSPSQVNWNQKFTFDPTTGWITTSPTAATKYCLWSKLTDNSVVQVTQCLAPDTGTTAQMLVWSQPGNTASTPYPQRYTFVDSSTDGVKRCLAVDDPNTHVPPYSPFYSTIVVARCDGTTGQKWNALANVAPPSRQNTVEQ